MNRQLESEIRRILKELRVNMPGLYLPVPMNARLEKFGPRLVVFSTYSELSDAGDSVEKYWLTLDTILN